MPKDNAVEPELASTIFLFAAPGSWRSIFKASICQNTFLKTDITNHLVTLSHSAQAEQSASLRIFELHGYAEDSVDLGSRLMAMVVGDPDQNIGS